MSARQRVRDTLDTLGLVLYNSPSSGLDNGCGTRAHSQVSVWSSGPPYTPDTRNMKSLYVASSAPDLGGASGDMGFLIGWPPHIPLIYYQYYFSPGSSRSGAPPRPSEGHLDLRARATSASRDLIASRYFSLMFSSTCFLNTTTGSSSCSIRHCGHSMLVSNQVMIHLL